MFDLMTFFFGKVQWGEVAARAETFEMEKISFTNGLESRTTTYDFSLATMHEKWGYIEEDRLFVDALDGKAAAAVTADDGYNVVELIEACYRSAREGARVHLGALLGKL